MSLCKFGQNPPFGSGVQIRTNADAEADGISTKSNMSRLGGDNDVKKFVFTTFKSDYLIFEPIHVKRVLIIYAKSKGSNELMHPDSHARSFAVRTHNI